ncbi:hypothetical protein G6F56_002724 [Rhizopus delemar]|nr:hypothetical protein G6F56_002724 [Rhizopus delemar]
MPNTDQTLFIVLFSLIAAAIVLATYVCWLKRIKMRTQIYEQQAQQAQQKNPMDLSPSDLQELKPVLLQKLYGNSQPPHYQTNPV